MIKFPALGHILTQQRYKQIKRYFHLAPNSNMPKFGTPQYDKLYKVRSVYNFLQESFRKHWTPGTFVSLDESVIPWKGKSSIKQYMRSKPVRWGFKFFCICDAITGYFIEFMLYSGSDCCSNKFGLCTDVVLEMCKRAGLEGTKRIIVADNYYSSPLLCAALARVDVGYVGTCRMSRRCVPKSLISFTGRICDVKRGAIKSAWLVLNSVDPGLPATPIFMCSWKDNKTANFIGTAGGVETLSVVRKDRKGRKEKVDAPNIASLYNERMGGVDLADQGKSRYSVAASVVTRKWWMRIFMGLLDMATNNAWILYKTSRKDLERYDHQDFILSVCESLCDLGSRASAATSLPYMPNPVHHEIAAQRGCTDCVVCRHNGSRKRTCYTCSTCRVPLCVDACFKIFHDLKLKVSRHVKKCDLREDED